MEENTDLKLTTEAWAKIVIERWENQIQRLNIIHTRKLLNSFTHFVNTQSNGNPDKIIFAFEFYGKFADMGVGRGVTLSSVEISNRKPKPWYSKVFWGQLMRLKEILVEKYQFKSQLAIINSIDETLLK